MCVCVYLTRAFSNTSNQQIVQHTLDSSVGQMERIKSQSSMTKHEGHELNEELFKHLSRQKRLTMMKEKQF